MRLWQAMLLVNLALAVGLGLGYGLWGRQNAALEAERTVLQEEAGRLGRERDAVAAGAAPGEQRWEARGVVRAAYPNMVIITHEDIEGALPARTTGFRYADVVEGTKARPGDPVRFWLHGTEIDGSVVVRMEAW